MIPGQISGKKGLLPLVCAKAASSFYVFHPGKAISPTFVFAMPTGWSTHRAPAMHYAAMSIAAMSIIEQFDAEVQPPDRGERRSGGGIRRRPRRLPSIGRLVFAAALLAGLAAYVYHSLPSACYRRAIKAIDSNAPTISRS